MPFPNAARTSAASRRAALVTRWLKERRSLLATVLSKVLPEADVVMMNPAHPDAPSACTLRL